MRCWLWVLVPAALCATSTPAEMDAHEYATEQTIRTEHAREQAEAQIRGDREREAREADERVAEEARARAEAETAMARRPYPERLLEARCTVCHPAGNFLRRQHTWLGWHLVISRMRAFNGAPVAYHEQFALAAELARVRPAAPGGALVEYGALAAALAWPLLVGWGWRRWRRHRRM